MVVLLIFPNLSLILQSICLYVFCHAKGLRRKNELPNNYRFEYRGQKIDRSQAHPPRVKYSSFSVVTIDTIQRNITSSTTNQL